VKLYQVHTEGGEGLQWTVNDGENQPIKPINEYLQFLKQAGSKPSTIKHHAASLAMFWEYLALRNLKWDLESVNELEASYMSFLEERQPKYTKRTFHQRVSPIQRFCKFHDLPKDRYVIVVHGFELQDDGGPLCISLLENNKPIQPINEYFSYLVKTGEPYSLIKYIAPKLKYFWMFLRYKQEDWRCAIPGDLELFSEYMGERGYRLSPYYMKQVIRWGKRLLSYHRVKGFYDSESASRQREKIIAAVERKQGGITLSGSVSAIIPINKYLSQLKQEGRSDNTLCRYANFLKIFCIYLDTRGMEWSQVKFSDFKEDYKMYLKKKLLLTREREYQFMINMTEKFYKFQE
jgi:hypothetical protein